MQPVLLVLQIIIAVFLIGVILLQKTAQDGGGLTGGGSTMGGLFTARGSANLLTRITAFLATVFILNSLALGFIASRHHQTGSLLDQIAPVSLPATEKSQDTPQNVPDAPKGPTVPQVPQAK